MRDIEMHINSIGWAIGIGTMIYIFDGDSWHLILAMKFLHNSFDKLTQKFLLTKLN